MTNLLKEHLQGEVASDIDFLLRDLLKIIKVLSLYPPENPLPRKMRASVGNRFVELVGRFDGFVFTIRTDEILYQDNVVFRDKSKEEALASLFFQAGIITLEFRRSLTFDEFNTFLDILKEYINDRSPDRDLVSLLWQEQFNQIKFTTVEDIILNTGDADVDITEIRPHYGMDDSDEIGVVYNTIFLDETGGESAEIAEDDGSEVLEPVNEELIEAARQMGMPSLSTPRSAGEQSLSLLIKDGYTLAEEDKLEVQRLLEENRYFNPYRSTARIMLEILRIWKEQKPFTETVSICEKVLDELLVNGAFAVAADFVFSLRSQQKELAVEKPSLAARLGEFLRRAGDQKRITRLTEIINEQSTVDIASIEIYLKSLGWESLNYVAGMLGQLVAKSARIMVCNHLAEYGRDQIAVIGNGVRSPHWYVVRNTVMILGRIGGDQTVNYLEMAAGHNDNRVRLETVEALSAVNTDQAVELLCRFLRDSDGGVRRASLNHLEKIGGRTPFESLWKIVTSDDFTDFSGDEQEWFLIAFSRLGGSEVVDILGRIIGRFYLFGGGRMVRSRLAALTALAHNQSDDAERVILKFTCSRRRWLREAASAALEQRRQLIYGGGGNGVQ